MKLLLFYLISIMLIIIVLRCVHKKEPYHINFIDIIIVFIPILNFSLLYLYWHVLFPDNLSDRMKLFDKLFFIKRED